MKIHLALLGSLLSLACAPIDPPGHSDASTQTSSSFGGKTDGAANSTTAPASTTDAGSSTASDDEASSTDAQARCDDLGEQEKDLLRTVYVMGHSNTPGSCDACTFEAFASTNAGYYYSFALTRLWERLEPCVDYEASFFVQRSPGEAQTLFLSVDVETVLPDGLHLSPLGHQVVADLFIAHLNAKFPALDLQPYGELLLQ